MVNKGNMDSHVKDYFYQSSGEIPKGSYYKVISLNDSPQIPWESILSEIPNFPRGWYELSRISASDRIEFSRDFWLSKLPYHPKLISSLNEFFSGLDDIGIFVTQRKKDDPLEPHLIYSISNDGGFFRGELPATQENLFELKADFPEQLFPTDYQAFLQIHNGFCKSLDTGIIPTHQMKNAYKILQGYLKNLVKVTTCGKSINPTKLFPFYESFGMPCFQCFWEEWYPAQEMGNIYYSDISKTFSEISDMNGDGVSLSFPTFTEWLIFYLERI